MLEAYSTDVTMAVDTAVPFNNISVKKGCTAELPSPSTIQLNKCGVYMVALDGVAGASATLQLYKDGIAQPQAQSTGTTLGFNTLVQVDRNNTRCCCSSPVNLQVICEDAVTLTNVNICVTKIC